MLALGIEITLKSHGVFATTADQVDRNMKESKSYLAKAIADCYDEGREHMHAPQTATKSYWMRLKKYQLAIVLAGLQYPTK